MQADPRRVLQELPVLIGGLRVLCGDNPEKGNCEHRARLTAACLHNEWGDWTREEVFSSGPVATHPGLANEYLRKLRRLVPWGPGDDVFGEAEITPALVDRIARYAELLRGAVEGPIGAPASSQSGNGEKAGETRAQGDTSGDTEKKSSKKRRLPSQKYFDFCTWYANELKENRDYRKTPALRDFCEKNNLSFESLKQQMKHNPDRLPRGTPAGTRRKTI